MYKYSHNYHNVCSLYKARGFPGHYTNTGTHHYVSWRNRKGFCVSCWVELAGFLELARKREDRIHSVQREWLSGRYRGPWLREPQLVDRGASVGCRGEEDEGGWRAGRTQELSHREPVRCADKLGISPEHEVPEWRIKHRQVPWSESHFRKVTRMLWGDWELFPISVMLRSITLTSAETQQPYVRAGLPVHLLLLILPNGEDSQPTGNSASLPTTVSRGCDGDG